MTDSTTMGWSINGRFLSQPKTGVQRYAGEIVRAMDAQLAARPAQRRATRWEIILPADCPDAPAFEAIEVRRSRSGRGHLWEQTVLPGMAKGGLISLANVGPLAHGRQIVCMHDANVFLEPSSYSRQFRMAYQAVFPLLARRAKAVTTVSGFSARMLSQFKVVGAQSIDVIPNGHEHALRWNASVSKFARDDAFARPFVFALGSRAKHKQLDLLLNLAPALDALGLDLVLSGASSAIFADAKLQKADNVIEVGFVSDDDLAAIFRRALCFAFPSRTEGFGLPLLEAMVHGAPIITSDAASMPEVCGDAALYAPADDPRVWRDQIERLAKQADLREHLKARGTARYPAFSWSRSAERYIALAHRLSPAPHGQKDRPRDAAPLRRAAS